MNYARKTRVPVDRSRFQIEHFLAQAGADGFAYMSSKEGAAIGFVFNEKKIRIMVPMPDPESKEMTHNRAGNELNAQQREQRYNQEVRRRWRALLLVIKAKLEAVDSGISEFEVEFLPYIVLPGGQTVAQQALPSVHEAYASGKNVPLLGTGL